MLIAAKPECLQMKAMRRVNQLSRLLRLYQSRRLGIRERRIATVKFWQRDGERWEGEFPADEP
jgi:hypothetical protein